MRVPCTLPSAYLRAESVILMVQLLTFLLGYGASTAWSLPWVFTYVLIGGMMLSVVLIALFAYLWRRKVRAGSLCFLLSMTSCIVFLLSVGFLVAQQSLEDILQVDNPVVGTAFVGSRVYAEEDGVRTPFIIASKNYNGSCLLLREYLLDDSVAYNGSCYSGSAVDKFLNEGYFQRLSDGVQDAVISSDIPVTSEAGLATHKDTVNSVRNSLFNLSELGDVPRVDEHDGDIEYIKRKIFLLSASEAGASVSHISFDEGEPLGYFKGDDSRIAYYENGDAGSWLLRTPVLSDESAVFYVSDDGVINMSQPDRGTDYDIRPAFCVPLDMPVTFDIELQGAVIGR